MALLSHLTRPHFSKLANRFFGSVPSLRNATLALLLFFSFDILTVHTENLETARVSLVLEPVIEHIDAAAGVLLRGCGMGKGCCISAASTRQRISDPFCAKFEKQSTERSHVGTPRPHPS